MRHQTLWAIAVVLYCRSAATLAAPADANAAAPAPKAATVSPYELRYHLDQNGTQPLHTFVLKWTGPSSNLQTIDVMLSDSSHVVQTINVPQDRVHLVWQEIGSTPGATKDRIVDLIDCNFDKFADLRLLKSWPYQVGDKSYMVWLYNDKSNRYELSEAMSVLPTPSVDPKTKRITSTKLTGFAGGEFEQSIFTVDGSGEATKLILQVKIVQTTLDPQHLNFQQEIRQREGDELQRICQLRLPAEGKPKRLWGTKSACAPFMAKAAPTSPRKKPSEAFDRDDSKDSDNSVDEPTDNVATTKGLSQEPSKESPNNPASKALKTKLKAE